MGEFQKVQQTSIATPFESGIIALFISYMKKSNITIDNSNIIKLKKLLSNTATEKKIDIDENGQKETDSLLYINPIEAFKQFDNYFNK